MVLEERILKLYECRRSLDEDLLNGKVFLYSWGGSNIGFRSVALQRGTSRNTVSRMGCIQISTWTYPSNRNFFTFASRVTTIALTN